ncbi:MAG TPA: ribosome silencing factor [Chitinophagaceae bacterium]
MSLHKILNSNQKQNYKRKTFSLLEQLASLTNRKKKSAVRLTRNSKIIKTIIAAIQEKKGENIVSLDLRKINEAVADFFIICEVGNQPQIRAIAENIEYQVNHKCDEDPYHHEGFQNLQWVLIDYVNVVVHVMLGENRKFYRLEEMWSDADVQEHND